MGSADAYRRFVRYYDAYVQDFASDIPLYLSCCAGKERIVEIGCGTGRVLKPLLEAGHRMVGVDISAEMLGMAAEKLQGYVSSQALRLLRHNFADAPVAERFDCALVTFYTLNYLLSNDDRRSFLIHLSESMEPGGLLAADLFCPRSVVHPEQAGVWQERTLNCGEDSVVVRDRREMAGQTERREQVFVTDEGEESIVTLRRFVTKQEMESLLRQAGFINLQFIDGYDVGAAHALRLKEETSGPYCVVAHKA